MSSTSLRSALLVLALATSACASDPVDLGIVAPDVPTSTTQPASTTSTTLVRLPLPDLDLPAWNGHAAAVTWTFDDGFGSHSQTISPMFAELGIEATFYPTCSAILFAPDAWQTVVDAGHEVANHTMTHAVAGPDTPASEIAGCDTVLDSVLGVTSQTFAYPNGVVGDPYYSHAEANYVASRGTTFPVNQIRYSSQFDWHAIPALALGEHWESDEDESESVQRPLDAIEGAVAERGWLTFIVHAVDEPGYAEIPMAELQLVLDATLVHDIWQASYVDVATHLRMQQVWPLIVPEQLDGGWRYTWTPVVGMSDVPIRVEVASGYLEQDGVAVAVQDGYSIIDARVGSFNWFES